MDRKRLFRACAALVAALVLAACDTASGPQKTLNGLAQALDDNNSAAFLSGLDMTAYSENHVRNLAANDPALRALDSLGRFLSLGGIDGLLSSVLDTKAQMEAEFTRGVSSGELMARCRSAETPDCPWVPQSLRDATVVELGDGAAIAKITTPARLTSWLALRKEGERWLVVGRAVLEATAREYALAAGKPVSGGAPGAAPAPAPRPAPDAQKGPADGGVTKI